MNKNKWEKTKYTERVRISKEDLEYLRMIKGKKSMAGKLHEIINKFRKEKDKL